MTPTFSDPADIDLPIGTWFWHVHHTTLCEPLTEPLVNRLDYIRKHKPESEQAIRLALISPVRGTLPAAYVKAGAASVKAGAAYDKAWAASVKARAAYDKARAAYDKARAAYDKAGAAYDKAGAAYDKAGAASVKAGAASVKAGAASVKAGAASRPELEALHAIEHPGCPWNGQTIFPGGTA